MVRSSAGTDQLIVKGGPEQFVHRSAIAGMPALVNDLKELHISLSATT